MSEIELHRKLLGDTARNAVLREALARVLRPGMTVADIGAGTGFLSFLARQLGASHCHLYEYTEALSLAREIAKRNRTGGLTFVHAHSTEVAKPPKADVVISETLGNFALEEGLLETLVDARRFLKKGGVIIPGELKQFVAPVVAPRLQDEIDVFPRVGHGIDLTPAREVALNNMYVKTIRPGDLPSETSARMWDRISFAAEGKPPASQRKGTARWTRRDLGEATTVRGFALWWTVELVPGVSLSTAPYAPATHWEQIYLPLLQPVSLLAGEELELRLNANTRGSVRVQWETRVAQQGKLRFGQRQDLARGRL